ncbi:MAG: hypothetical protein PGN11_19610 [Quadrisphaera sp.]
MRLGDLPLDGVLAGALGTGDRRRAGAAHPLPRRRRRDPRLRVVGDVHARRCAAGEGLRTGNLVRCPFHHACFDLRSGEALLAPAYEPLTRYDVEVSGQGDDALVRVTGASEEPAPGPDAATGAAGGALHRVVVVGGGAAGFARSSGCAGRATTASWCSSPPSRTCPSTGPS